jgi:hypothetical protein
MFEFIFVKKISKFLTQNTVFFIIIIIMAHSFGGWLLDW